MANNSNEPRQESGNEFGLPQAEFKPIGHGSNRWIRLTAIIVGLVFVVGSGIVYWFLYRSASERTDIASYKMDVHEEIADIDFIESDQDAAPSFGLEGTEQQATKAEDNLFQELVEETSTEVPPPSATAEPSKGKVTRINTLQGKYYVITGSFIDDDLAVDYAEQLAKEGEQAMILEPQAGKNYFRVAVAYGSTRNEAESKAQALKATHGNSIWVLKY